MNLNALKIPDSFMGKPIDGATKKLEARLKETKSGIVVPSGSLGIDLQPALNGEGHTQKDWIAKYVSQEGEFKGKRMITAPDVYQVGKDGSEDLLKSLRDDFVNDLIITGTYIIYERNNLSGEIFHDAYLAKTRDLTNDLAKILCYQGTSVKDVVKGNGLFFAQALFGTKDKPNEIISTLERLTQKPADKINFSTPPLDSRRKVCAVGFSYSYDDDRFLVSGNYGYGFSGRSRGVLLDSESKTRSKSK